MYIYIYEVSYNISSLFLTIFTSHIFLSFPLLLLLLLPFLLYIIIIYEIIIIIIIIMAVIIISHINIQLYLCNISYSITKKEKERNRETNYRNNRIYQRKLCIYIINTTVKYNKKLL